MGGRELWNDLSTYGRNSTGVSDRDGSNTAISDNEVVER